ncbi:MAG: hypothetical protein ACYSU7_16520 [Planctomycetota bacterium]|jgi:hypothetical protein
MGLQYRVISIGTLPANSLWGEDQRAEVRTGHATTTLICPGGDTHILVDPSLPPVALLARLGERAPRTQHRITHVFLTSADALHRRAIEVFEDATWLVHEPELDAARAVLSARLSQARDEGDDEVETLARHDLDILGRCRPAPDTLAESISFRCRA